MIVYRPSVEGLVPEQLQGFFVGWPKRPSPETLLEILRGSRYVELAMDTRTDRVIGLTNAVSDGILSAYIPLLEVLPEYKRRGIGAMLVERLLRRLEHLYMVDLVCDDAMVGFYHRLGFHHLQGMALREFQNQDGLAGLARQQRELAGG